MAPKNKFEHTIVPDGNPWPDGGDGAPQWYPEPGSQEPYYWGDVAFDSSVSPIVLGNDHILSRYRKVTLIPGVPIDPDPDPIGPGPNPFRDPTQDDYSYSYPPFEIISQSLTCVNRDVEDIFETQVGDELYTAAPGNYTFSCKSGIKPGAAYVYPGVFNRTEVAYIERLEDFDSTPIKNQQVPTLPYDEENFIFPIDTLTQFKPDTRKTVRLVYRLFTVLKVEGNTISDEVYIYHNVHQNINNWSGAVKRYVDRAYFTKGRRVYKDLGDRKFPEDYPK